MLVSWQKLLSLLPDLKMHSTLPGESQLPQLDQLVVEVGITPGKYTQKKKTRRLNLLVIRLKMAPFMYNQAALKHM